MVGRNKNKSAGAVDEPLRTERVPFTLQAVFLRSNRGKEVHQAPPQRAAQRSFFQNRIFKRSSRLVDAEKKVYNNAKDKVLTNSPQQQANSIGVSPEAANAPETAPKPKSLETVPLNSALKKVGVEPSPKPAEKPKEEKPEVSPNFTAGNLLGERSCMLIYPFLFPPVHPSGVL
jgi:hypothetical protein